jgi:peptidoglycan hydrolase CwlO-like protein
VEKAMKTYADGVLHVLDGTNSRLSQVERATQNLRQSVASLKDSVDDYYEQTNSNYGRLNEHVMEVMSREISKTLLNVTSCQDF